MPRLVVIGGGIAGLAAARAARLAADRSRLSLEVTLLESNRRFGGQVWTETVDGLPLEWGPDSFLAAKPEAARLAEDLGLGRELVAPGPAARKTYLWLKGRLRPLPPGMAMGVPAGLTSLLAAIRSGIVGPAAALRAAVEPLLPARRSGDPTVGEVVRRRLGRRTASRLVAPLVGGVFGVPADDLSMAAALPDLARARSLVLAAMRRPRGAGPVFLTLRGGMGTLVDRLVDALGAEDLRYECPATSVAPDGDGFAVETPEGPIRAAAVLVATPANVAARLLAPVAPKAAEPLAAIPHRGTVVVHLRYGPGTLGRPLDGSGYLVAAEEEEEAMTAACTWVGAKWPHLSAGGLRLRAAASAPRALALPDEVLRDRVATEVDRVMRATRSPEDARLVRWPEVLPVYAPGHLERVAAARRALPDRLALAGAAYEGVGVPDCIRTGEEAAASLVAALTS